jgi:hypothetical protein
LDKKKMSPNPGGQTPQRTIKKESRNIGLKISTGISKTEMTLPKIDINQNNISKIEPLELSPSKAEAPGASLTRNESDLTPWTA